MLLKNAVVLFMVLFFFQMQGQESYFVTAENGLNVREGATVSSLIIDKIPYGIVIEKTSDTGVKMSVTDNGEILKGTWVEIEYYKYYYSTPYENDEQGLTKGYVFDAYLQPIQNNAITQIDAIDKIIFNNFKKGMTPYTYDSKKIENLDSIKKLLKNRVTWVTEEDEYGEKREDVLKSIRLNNGRKVLINQMSNDYGFAEGWSGYYPEYDILVLEGGHSSDMCFSIATGETTTTIGNPQYIIPSPKNTYRLNGSFGGQECVSYFFQKKSNGTFKYLTEFNIDFDVCEFKEFYWLDETTFIYSTVNYMNDSTNGELDYFKGEIQDEKVEHNSNSFYKIRKLFPLKKMALVDSTNFDNVKKIKPLNKEQLQALQIEKVFPHFYEEGYLSIALPSYRLNMSSNFYSLVVIVYQGNHEMKSVLITYSLKGKLVDYKVVAYDEIAEGWSRIESQIEKDKISITDIMWLDEKEEEITVYKIDYKGTFVKIN